MHLALALLLAASFTAKSRLEDAERALSSGPQRIEILTRSEGPLAAQLDGTLILGDELVLSTTGTALGAPVGKRFARASSQALRGALATVLVRRGAHALLLGLAQGGIPDVLEHAARERVTLAEAGFNKGPGTSIHYRLLVEGDRAGHGWLDLDSATGLPVGRCLWLDGPDGTTLVAERYRFNAPQTAPALRPDSPADCKRWVKAPQRKRR